MIFRPFKAIGDIDHDVTTGHPDGSSRSYEAKDKNGGPVHTIKYRPLDPNSLGKTVRKTQEQVEETLERENDPEIPYD